MINSQRWLAYAAGKPEVTAIYLSASVFFEVDGYIKVASVFSDLACVASARSNAP